jgi:hypothetical protein
MDLGGKGLRGKLRGPQGLKPVFFRTDIGTAEAVPFPKPCRSGPKALPNRPKAICLMSQKVLPEPKAIAAHFPKLLRNSSQSYFMRQVLA